MSTSINSKRTNLKGFITIATGKTHYYELAANLVTSYRLHSKNPYPFAIIADEKNEYTNLFDDIIITNESSHSFMDKFLLLKLCPYKETIFIDADSLAYGDLNVFWEEFDSATDFSCIGINIGLHDKGAWYNVEDIWKYGSLIKYKTRVHMGVCFIRESPILKKLYDDCQDILTNYNKLHFLLCASSYDEAIMAIAMPMNNLYAIAERTNYLAVYPYLTKISADIIHGKLKCTTEWGGTTDHGHLLHFGTSHTYDYLYKYEVERINYYFRSKQGCLKWNDIILYRWGIRWAYLSVQYFFTKKMIKCLVKMKKKILK